MSPPTLIFGAGWIGSALAQRMPNAVLSRADIADEQAIAAVLDEVRPARVVNCAGKNGRPNIDWCEVHPLATYRSNVSGPILLATECSRRELHLTHLSSGCLYQGDNDGRGFAEDDPPNFHASLYARTKALAETALRDFGALQLRLRLPLASEPGPRNLLTKLLSFEHVVRVANSVTVLDDFWAPATALIERGETGVWNLVNEGVETHDALLELWRERVDPEHRFRVVEPADLDAKVRAPRSNCVLSTAKLRAAGLAMPDVSEALPRIVDAYAACLHAGDRP